MNDLLQVENLAVTAGSKSLLEGLAFSLLAGERIGLQGPSGCGKTTLLRTICGLTDPADGTIRLNGKTAQEIGWPSFRRQVVFVAQQPYLFQGTVRENLEKPFRYKHGSKNSPWDKISEWLEIFHLQASILKEEAPKLSQGEKQRVGLVRALSLEPKVLLLDEPTSALDPDAASSVEKTVRELCEQKGLAALVVTHDPDQLQRWCNRRITLTDFLYKGEKS